MVYYCSTTEQAKQTPNLPDIKTTTQEQSMATIKITITTEPNVEQAEHQAKMNEVYSDIKTLDEVYSSIKLINATDLREKRQREIFNRLLAAAGITQPPSHSEALAESQGSASEAEPAQQVDAKNQGSHCADDQDQSPVVQIQLGQMRVTIEFHS